MDLTTYIVESEEAYLDLIADLSKYGKHDPNGYSKPDKDGMSVCDRFRKLPPHMAEDFLGVRDYEHKVTTVVDENGVEWEEEPGCGEGPLDREKLHICPTLAQQINIPPPTEKDYPILVMWDWEDSFDRMGDIKVRWFDWQSLRKIKRISADILTPIARKHRLWNRKYRKQLEDWKQKQREGGSS